MGIMGTSSTRRRRTGAALLIVGAAALATAGCTPVEGSGSAAASEVAAYQSTIAASRAAAAASAKTSACTSWRSGYDVRNAQTDATVKATQDGDWNWDSIGPALQTEIAGIATESGKLPAVIATADLAPTLKTVIGDYRTKLDAYGEALRADQTARATTSAWARSNPALKELDTVARNIMGICSTS